jgi:hypothetical protein
MKKILNIITGLICVTSLFTSCETERDNPVLDSSVTKPVITSTLPATAIIAADNLDDDYATVTFSPAAYSIPVPVTSLVQLSLSNSFPDNSTITVGAATSEESITITNKMLNSAIVAIGGKTLEPNTAWLRIKSSVTATTGSPSTELQIAFSDPVQVTVTPYEPQPAYVYAVGAFQGWNRTGGYSLVSMTDNGTYIGYVNFPETGSGFLILPNNNDDWSHKWGSDDGATLIVDGGSDIRSPGAGWYRIVVNLNALTIAMEPFGRLGITGSINNWGTPDVPMDYVPANHRFEATITCAGNDEIKFRLNEDWGTNWGGTDGVASIGGKNITIADAGTYLVTLDLINMEYSVVKQ